MPVLLDDIPVHKNSTRMLSAGRNTPFPHPSQKMRRWDDFLRYLLKQQAEAFFDPDGCVKWTCSGGAGFTFLHLHLLAGGGGEAPAHRPQPLPAASGCQMVAVAGRYHAVQKVSFLSAPSHTGVNLLILLGKALVAVQVSGSTCNRSSCLQHTGKEAGKQARLCRALPVLSGWGFNSIQMCPQVLVFSLPICSFSFFSLFFRILPYLNEGTPLKASILEAPSNVTKKV